MLSSRGGGRIRTRKAHYYGLVSESNIYSFIILETDSGCEATFIKKLPGKYNNNYQNLHIK